MRLLLSRMPYGIGGATMGAAAVSDPAVLVESFRNWFPNAAAALLQPPAGAAVAIAAKVDDVQTAALAASVRAIEAMLQQQRSNSPLRTTLLLFGTAAACFALRYGWEQFGWATPIELKEGLVRVSETVSACKDELKELIGRSFVEVGQSLTGVARNVQAVKEELKAEVHAVGESVKQLEQRMCPIESDVRRTAQGVDLLCEVVSGLSSSLSSNASPDLRRRLDSFTGNETGLERVLAPPQSPREPLPPPPPVLPELTSARPEFLQSILQPRFEVR